ncbi:MAG: ABC transporter permease [Actinobacteria bacterium]|nr:ABC transporter permease [Actinomycetota bacterium]
MTDLLTYVIKGVPLGCVFALLAIGLVLTYKTSGVFNLAFGAQAFLAAAVYYDVRVRHGWPTLPAFSFAVLVVSPLVGLLLERLIFRYLRTASPLAKLVSALGLLVALPSIVQLWLGKGQTFGVVGIWWDDNALYRFGDFVLDGKQMAILVCTGAAVVALGLLFRYAPIGLRMRAVVESPRMTELAGVNADRVGGFSWMLSSLFAGLAGVLLAPSFAQLGANDFTTLLVAAIAAAAFARLTSIPLALLGGILLGVGQALLAGYLPPASLLARNLRPSLPFIALFLLLLFWPGLRTATQSKDPMAGVDPPPLPPAAEERSHLLTVGTRVFGVVVFGVLVLLSLTTFSSYWLLIFTQAAVYSTIFLSITVITGMGGQVSLAQATFAGIGAFATAQIVDTWGFAVLPTMLVGALVAAVIGALLAVPALRLGGLFLSLGTLAFALMFQYVLVPMEWVGGGLTPLEMPRPAGLDDDKAFFLFCIAVLAVVSVIVILIRKGTTGQFLDALRGSEVAAQSIGINPVRSKILVFAVSAGIAGLGGALLSMQEGEANPVRFEYTWGLFFVVIVVTLGARTVEGAINAGLGFMLMPEVLKWVGLPASWQFVVFGLGAITYAKYPDGVLEANKRKSLAFIDRHLPKRFRTGPDRGGPGAAAPVAPADVAVPTGGAS